MDNLTMYFIDFKGVNISSRKLNLKTWTANTLSLNSEGVRVRVVIDGMETFAGVIKNTVIGPSALLIRCGASRNNNLEEGYNAIDDEFIAVRYTGIYKFDVVHHGVARSNNHGVTSSNNASIFLHSSGCRRLAITAIKKIVAYHNRIHEKLVDGAALYKFTTEGDEF